MSNNTIDLKQGPTSCFARALPTDGSHGGQAWGPTKSFAESKAMIACRHYSSQTGGNPDTCRIIYSKCNTSSVAVRLENDDEILNFR